MVSETREALERLRKRVRSAALDGARVENGPVLHVRGPVQKRWLEIHARDALKEAFGGPVRLVADEAAGGAGARPALARPRLSGPAGEFALRVVRSFVEGGPAAAPLVVLHGPARSGKSLLVEWACALAGPRAFRLDLERVRAGRSRGLVPRKPLVVADGVERLAGRAAAQRVLCSILDAVLDRGDRALVTMEGHPAAREGLSVALLSRLRGGLAVPLAEPGRAELRLQLRERARRRGRRLPLRWEEQLLELGAADALRALDRRLDGGTEAMPAPAPPIERMKDAAARVFGVERALLDGPCKRRSVVEARRAVMVTAVASGMGAAEVAAAFGVASERTVREAGRWAERAAQRDRRIAALLQEVGRGW